MAKLVVQSLKFTSPMAELTPRLGVSTILDENINGWSAVVDEEMRVVAIKVRKTTADGVKTFSYRVPFEAIQWYRVTAKSADASGEPADPK